MKKKFSDHIKIILITLFALCPQGAFSSKTTTQEDILEVGSLKVPLKTFVETLFSEAFDEKRTQTLIQLSKHGNTQALYQTPLFQNALGQMGQGKRNAFIISLPFEEKALLKHYMHWSCLGSLGQAELSKADKSVLALQELNSDNIKDMIGSLDTPELRSLFGTLFSLEETAPADDASFLEKYFSEQKGKSKILSKELAEKSDQLKKTQKGSKVFHDLVGILNFLGKGLYAANNPKDHFLENFPDGLLFAFSHELAHLELTRYFLKNVAEREDRAIDALAVQLETAKDDLLRQRRLKVLLNTTMLKREIVASGAVALGKFLSRDKKDDQILLDAYMPLGNFFYKYINATIDPHASSTRLPELHKELCKLTSSLDLTPPDLLDMGLSSSEDAEEITVVVNEGSGSGESIEVVSEFDVLSSKKDYHKASPDLKEVAQALGKQAISQNSMEQARKAGLVEDAIIIGKAAQEASDKGDLELANRLIERLVQIKKELSGL